MDTEQKYIFEPEYFGPLWPYVADEGITDIDYNGHQLWLTDSNGRRWQILRHGITDAFVREFSQRVANRVSRQFNKMNNLLEAETETLRISIVHESVAVSGRSICLRKSLPLQRIAAGSAIQDGYCSAETMQLLANCVIAGMNMVFCGEPGAGKTECAKFFSGFIPAQDRVITIEDTPEWHYRTINPGKDCVELKVTEQFSYTKAIKACLRQNPRWIMLSEARSTEVKSLLECWSTGVHGLTTLHTDDTRKVPDRILNMMEDRTDADRLENDVYTFIDAAVLIRRKYLPESGKNLRYIDQICFFSREKGRNMMRLVLEGGRPTGLNLPDDILQRMRRAQIQDPCCCSAVRKKAGIPDEGRTGQAADRTMSEINGAGT